MNEHGKIVSCNCVDLKKCFNKVEHKHHGKFPNHPPSLLDAILVLPIKVT